MKIKLSNTVGEIIEELSKLPQDQAVAFPIRWTSETFQLLWGDALLKPLTDSQWAEVAEDYCNALAPMFWEDSEEAMRHTLEQSGYLKEEY